LLAEAPLALPTVTNIEFDEKDMESLGDFFFMLRDKGYCVLVYKNRYSECRVSLKLLEGTAEEIEEGQGRVVVLSKMLRYTNYSAIYSSTEEVRMIEHHIEKERDYYNCKTKLLSMI
jgi:hypothetical protein